MEKKMRSLFIDSKKLEIVNHVDGPMLVIAGPGAGKTMAIVKRVVHLIGACGIAPESIFVSTFTEKAAKELLTRISRRLMEKGLKVSPNEMYIGTMHSLFLRILKDYSEFTRLKKNYKTFDDFDQKYTVYRRMYDFRKLDGFDLVADAQSNWTNAERLCALLNKVREEAIDPERLLAAPEPEVAALGRAYAKYMEILEGDNAIDFSAIQSEMLALLDSQPQVLAELREKIRYLVVDEYQDTNTIQERILLKLAGPAANICVVGDEDQSIYRFRGASVRNILQFAENFPQGTCKTVILDTNFRSHPDIVSFYNRWMDGCDWKDGPRRFRYDKTISPQPGKSSDDCLCVVRVAGEDVDAWCEEVRAFIESLRAKGVVTDLNQIAFLFHSVKNKDVVRLADYLEAHGIGVFSPRSAQFFQRDVIRRMIGLFFFLFPQIRTLPTEMIEHQAETAAYYQECMRLFADAVKGEPKRHATLLAWAKKRAAQHKVLSRTTDYTFLTLFYEALKFPMFADLLAVDHDGTPKTSRDAFNLNYASLSLAMRSYLDPNRKNAALEHVKRYVERSRDAFKNILAAEYDVSIPTEGFILQGVIDLLRGDGDTVEIVDFKTDKKPDVNSTEDMARVANYQRQLEVYSHIVEEKLGRRVSKMHLYYTRVEGENPYVTWDFNPERVEGTLRKFGDTVGRIKSHRFSNKGVVKCARLCDGCDMRFYCNYK